MVSPVYTPWWVGWCTEDGPPSFFPYHGGYPVAHSPPSLPNLLLMSETGLNPRDSLTSGEKVKRRLRTSGRPEEAFLLVMASYIGDLPGFIAGFEGYSNSETGIMRLEVASLAA